MPTQYQTALSPKLDAALEIYRDTLHPSETLHAAAYELVSDWLDSDCPLPRLNVQDVRRAGRGTRISLLLDDPLNDSLISAAEDAGCKSRSKFIRGILYQKLLDA